MNLKWLGQTIRYLRELRGETQKGLAKRAGISVGYLYRIELGLENPTLKVLLAIARALEVRLKDLCELEGIELEREEVPWEVRLGRIEAELKLLLLELLAAKKDETAKAAREQLKAVLQKTLQCLAEEPDQTKSEFKSHRKEVEWGRD